MKAFMSDVNGGPAFLRAPLYADVTGHVHTHPDMARDDAFAAAWALREAERILGEVEPGQVYHRHISLLAILDPYGDMASACAEALRAFVEEEASRG